MYQQALRFIARKHAGQKRRNGNPYIIHPIRVSQDVKGHAEKVVALLHDVIEDTDTKFEELWQFGSEVVSAVEALTHREGEPYDQYILRVKENPIAVTVKIADIADNLSDSPTPNAVERGAKALDMLIN